MVVLIRGKTVCPLCEKTIQDADDVVAFPAFLSTTHPLGAFSDAAFHRACFEQDQRSAAVQELFQRYRQIWASRPKNLKTIEEIEAWGREAFKNFP